MGPLLTRKQKRTGKKISPSSSSTPNTSAARHQSEEEIDWLRIAPASATPGSKVSGRNKTGD